MNFLGKVFVVLILLMSIMFMALSIAVYATHKNWQEVAVGPNGLQTQLQQARTEYDQARSQHNRRVEELTAEIESTGQQVRKLEAERVALVDRNVSIQTELDQLKQERRDATAAVASTQANNDRLAAEVTDLRQQIRTTEQLRDRLFGETLAATEEMHQTAGQLVSATERSQQLTEQVAGMTTVMRESGLDPATDPNAVVPNVDGFVSQIRRTSGGQFVEVTIGADDGLKAGHTVEVYRGGRYLGRIEILRTSPDKAVGRVVRGFQQGQIQEGDRVATRLRVG